MKPLFRLTISAIALGMVMACSTTGLTPTATHEAPRQETRQARPSPTNTLAPSPTSAPATSTPPGTIPPSFFAMNTVDEDDYPKVTFGTLSHPAIGAWAWIEQTKGEYDFSKFDKKISAAVAHGLVDSTNTASVAITLGMTPPWAAADSQSCKTTGSVTWCTSGPSQIEDWKKFLKALLNHFDGHTMPHIRYYELWNEMNIDSFYTGTQADLLALAKAAYPIIHTDPHSIMLTPSVAGELVDLTKKGGGAAAMRDYLDAGGAQYADGGAFHGYIAGKTAPYPMPEDENDSIVAKVESMRKVFDQHGLAGKPMCDTEGSWGNDEDKEMAPDWQTAFLVRWYLLQAGLHVKDNLQFAAWFTWGKRFHWGTIETEAGEPTQAGIAFNQVYSWLVGAVMEQPCSSAADGTWTCALTRPGGYHALAVWNTQGSKAYTSSGAAYVDYRDLAGNTVKIKKGEPVTIGAKPILLETSQSTQGLP